MTYTPSFLMKASFFRYFVNALGAVKEQQKFFHSPYYYIRVPRPRQPVAARDNALPKLYNGKAMA